MFGENAPQHIQSDPGQEVINDILCEGYSVICKSAVGYWLLTDGEGIQWLESKENLTSQLEDLYRQSFEQSPEIARQDWDDIHLICIHMPVDKAVLDLYVDPIFQGNIMAGGNSIMPIYGIPVKEKIVTDLRAFDLHDDIVMDINAEVQEQEAKDEAQIPPLL